MADDTVPERTTRGPSDDENRTRQRRMEGPTARRRPVPPGLRLANLLSLVLLAVGAGLYARAWVGLRGLADYVPDANAPHFTGVARFTHLWELSRLGGWLVAAGLAVAVLAAAGAVIVRRRDGGARG